MKLGDVVTNQFGAKLMVVGISDDGEKVQLGGSYQWWEVGYPTFKWPSVEPLLSQDSFDVDTCFHDWYRDTATMKTFCKHCGEENKGIR